MKFADAEKTLQRICGPAPAWQAKSDWKQRIHPCSRHSDFHCLQLGVGLEFVPVGFYSGVRSSDRNRSSLNRGL